MLNNIQQEIELIFKKNLINQMNNYIDHYRSIHGDISDEMIVALYGFINFISESNKTNIKNGG